LGIAYQFYNVDLVDILDADNGEDTVAFVDDTLLLVQAKTLADSNVKVKQMMVRHGGGLNWATTHQSHFTLDKFWVMGLTRRREPNPSGSLRPGPFRGTRYFYAV